VSSNPPPAVLNDPKRALTRAWHSLETWAVVTFAPTLLRWWGNPLLHQARAARPLPWRALARVIPVAAGLLAVVAIVAWVITERALGAAMIALPLGVTLAALLSASVSGTLVTLGQLRAGGHTPRGMTTAVPHEIVWGLALVALWRLRWLIVAALIVTPALMIGALHLDVTAFANYRESALALGSAAPPEQVRLLTPGAGIPYFRLAMRALSAGLLALAALPLLASLGVSSALLLRDTPLSLTLALVGNIVALLVVLGVWQVVTTVYFLGQGLEVVRFALIAATLAGTGGLAWLVNRQNAELLVNIPPDEGII